MLPGGTGTAARLTGYSVGGKTGSAQIFDILTRKYSHNEYNGSFMGFAPLTNPAIVVVVSLNGTHGTAGFGGQAAAPVFHAVAQEALRVLDVPKDLPDEPPAPVDAKKEEVNDLSIADLDSSEPNILEDSDDADVDGGSGDSAPGPRVPNFRGMTMRAVLAEAASKGMIVVANGSGVARLQDPPAGAPLRDKERIRVQFAR